MAFFFRAEATSKSENQMKRKTTTYLPLVPRGSLINTSGSPENLWKNLAPVYYVHYENVDVEKNAENMLEKFVFENRKNLENAIHYGNADHLRNKQYLRAEMAQLLSLAMNRTELLFPAMIYSLPEKMQVLA